MEHTHVYVNKENSKDVGPCARVYFPKEEVRLLEKIVPELDMYYRSTADLVDNHYCLLMTVEDLRSIIIELQNELPTLGSVSVALQNKVDLICVYNVSYFTLLFNQILVFWHSPHSKMTAHREKLVCLELSSVDYED
ncbi:MAG: hypothetical protein GY861_20980 [bacterium]|nr:hypothetical protein [bacterium]